MRVVTLHQPHGAPPARLRLLEAGTSPWRRAAVLGDLSTALLCAMLAGCAGGARPLRLGTTTTVEHSGALAVLDSLANPVPATVIAPSGQILSAAARGDLDVVITHAPSLERRLLVVPGRALLRCPFVASQFAIVGPASDPADVGRASSAAAAFGRIARAHAHFVSRADSSGTNVKELALWAAADVRPERPWYIESGADQATTLHLADERAAYALADLPTFGKLQDLGLRILFTADTALTNPYTLYVVRGTAAEAGKAYAAWAMRVARPAILAMRLPDGTAAFAARAGDCAAPDPVSTTGVTR